MNVDSRHLSLVGSTFPVILIFMDCQMPEMDGLETTRAIRQREGKRSRIPIVAMTASAMQGDRELCLESGMDDYLSKPVKSTDLQGMLESWAACCDERKSGHP